MKRLNTAALVFVGFFATASVAFTTGALFKIDGAAEFVVEKSGNGKKVTSTETRFHEDLYGTPERLFKIVTRSSYTTELDGLQQRSYIEAYETKNKTFDTKAWTMRRPLFPESVSLPKSRSTAKKKNSPSWSTAIV